MKRFFTLIVMSALLFGCANGGPKQTAGTYIGAASGAIIGSQIGGGTGQFAAIALGTLIGSQLGAHIGSSMDEKDKQLASNTVVSALETKPDNIKSTWRNPNNQHHGDVVVVRTVEKANKVCRDYAQTVYIDGKQETVRGRACRNIADTRGAWFVEDKN